MEVLFSQKCILIFGLIIFLLIDSTSDQKNRSWFNFISSTSLVMSIATYYSNGEKNLWFPSNLFGEDFPYRKDHMEMYVEFTHYQLWHIITIRDIKIEFAKEDW